MSLTKTAVGVTVFDICGVLNPTPARGDNGFRADPDKIARLLRLPGPYVCLSFWRGWPDKIELPFDYTLAPNGNKRDCVPINAIVVIDDQPSKYDGVDVPLYVTDGHVGLTDEDVENILERFFKRKR